MRKEEDSVSFHHLYWPVDSSMQEDVDPASSVSVPSYELILGTQKVYTPLSSGVLSSSVGSICSDSLESFANEW